jgi:hypothetical protein
VDLVYASMNILNLDNPLLYRFDNMSQFDEIIMLSNKKSMPKRKEYGLFVFLRRAYGVFTTRFW